MSGTAELYSTVPGSLPASARARPQNWTKPRSYNSKKLAIERSKRQKQLRKSALKKLQSWLDSKPKLLRMRRSNGSVRRKLPRGSLKSSNNKLQPLKKVAIQQISVSEKPHLSQQKNRQSVVVLLLHQVGWLRVRLGRPPHPNLAYTPADSRRQRDTSSANALVASIYQYTKKFHDNSFCGWLNNLIFLIVRSWWGGSLRDLARHAAI
jgi:hypothetical protein